MNKLETCRQAAILCGEQPIISLDEGTITAKYLSERFDSILQNLQIETYWHFLLTRKQLQRDPSIDDLEFDYAFRLPNGFIRLKQFLENREKDITIPHKYDIVGQNILCDAEKIAIEYTELKDIDNIPFYLNGYMQYALAADIAYTLTENAQLGQRYSQLSQFELRKAKTMDGQNERPTKMWTSNYLKMKRQGGLGYGRD